jgi:hypothetical protein
MTGFQHRELAGWRWSSSSLAEQLGKVVSEVSRAVSSPTRHPQRTEAVRYRALELIDLTLGDPRHPGSLARLREVSRLRNVVADFFARPNTYGSTAASLQNYLDACAVAARRH